LCTNTISLVSGRAVLAMLVMIDPLWVRFVSGVGRRIDVLKPA
jgi:hypothetical protein